MIANLVLLCGADGYRVFERKKFYEKAFLKKYPEGEIEYFDLSHDFNALENALLTPNLFGSKRLIFAEGFWTPEKFEVAEKSKFFENLEQAADLGTLILVENALDKRLKSSKFFLSQAKTETFDPMDRQKLGQFLVEYMQKQGGGLDLAVALEFLDYCGTDLWHLTQELEKLRLYCEGRSITRSDFQALCLRQNEMVIWDFLESLSKKNVQKAIGSLKTLLERGESLYQILALVQREIRIHVLLKSATEDGLSGGGLAEATKLHPFVIQKTLPLSRAFSWKQIESFYEGLYALDKGIKTGTFQSSTDDMGEILLALERLIIDLGQKDH